MTAPSRALAGLAVLAAACCPLIADDDDLAPRPAPPGSLIVIDGKGKEQKVSKYTFTAGTRHLGWLAAAKDGEKDKGPEALVIRDALNFGYLDGVVAYVPLDRIRSVTFDEKKNTVTVRAATSDKADDDVSLVGSTAYKGINKYTLEADVDKGDAGVASLKFQGGVAGGAQAFRFPPPKVTAPKSGRPAVVQTIDQRYKRTDAVTDLQPLYRFGKEERPATLLMFKKTLKLDVSKIKKIAAGEKEGKEIVWRVTGKDDDESALTLLEAATIDGKQGVLTGMVGKTPYGHRFFPLTEISAIDFDKREAPKEKEKEKLKADTR